MVSRFYLDTEYTHGNYYLGDIFEIAILSERSGYIFHTYIKIHHKLPSYVQRLCNITDNILEMKCQPFCEVMDDVVEFINHESRDDNNSVVPIIIAHGGFLTDFPLLLVNCMKACYDYTRLAKYIFVDSMKMLQDKGYEKPGLDSFSTSLTIERRHSAIYDVKLLRDVVNKLLLQDIYTATQQHSYKLDDILQYLKGKLPLTIRQLFELADQATSQHTMELELYKHAAIKTALNIRQIYKIAFYYYNL